MPQLKLVHKMLLLVAVPLIFQCLFVVILEAYWQKARMQKQSAEATAKALVKAEQLKADLEFQKLHMNLRGVVGNLYDGELEKLRADSLTHADALIPLLKKRTAYKDIAEELTPLAKALRSPDTSADTINQGKAALDRFLKEEENKLNAEDEWAQKGDQTIHQVIMSVGLTLNVLACFLLVLLFTHSVSSRLRIITANSERFSQGKDLLPHPGGGDEISNLDSVFREMTSSVQSMRAREHQMLSMVSHDLRTPMNMVLATLSSLSAGIYGPLSASGEERVKQSEAAIERMSKLTNDLLDFERLASSSGISTRLEPVSLRPVVEHSVESVWGFSDYKGVKVRVDFTQDYVILADEERLVQLFVNLLTNAIKFAPNDSLVDVTAGLFANNFVEVRVRDRGPGIPAKDQAQIFEPYKQSESQPNSSSDKLITGTGLGLAICKSIAQAHGGTIGFNSGPEGTVFYVRLRLEQ